MIDPWSTGRDRERDRGMRGVQERSGDKGGERGGDRGGGDNGIDRGSSNIHKSKSRSRGSINSFSSLSPSYTQLRRSNSENSVFTSPLLSMQNIYNVRYTIQH